MAVEAVKIRKLPDWVIDAHKSKAEQEGISLEEELRNLLTESALKPQRDFAAKAEAWNSQLKTRYGTLSDSTEIIREDREERW
ncbi:MAG: hypothetical protein IT165_18060 [Bryobacterales bacterium]|jgi:plasmid stability protein|nr:hypothetical protein [Bryobacterales bacterium]